MNLEQFAKKAGVSIVECEPSWGGTIAFTEKDSPNTTYCGYKTKEAAYKSWLTGKFGKSTGKAVLALLTKTEETV